MIDYHGYDGNHINGNIAYGNTDKWISVRQSVL